jgi:hypothetical protein
VTSDLPLTLSARVRSELSSIVVEILLCAESVQRDNRRWGRPMRGELRLGLACCSDRAKGLIDELSLADSSRLHIALVNLASQLDDVANFKQNAEHPSANLQLHLLDAAVESAESIIVELNAAVPDSREPEESLRNRAQVLAEQVHGLSVQTLNVSPDELSEVQGRIFELGKQALLGSVNYRETILGRGVWESGIALYEVGTIPLSAATRQNTYDSMHAVMTDLMSVTGGK